MPAARIARESQTHELFCTNVEAHTHINTTKPKLRPSDFVHIPQFAIEEVKVGGRRRRGRTMPTPHFLNCALLLCWWMLLLYVPCPGSGYGRGAPCTMYFLGVVNCGALHPTRKPFLEGNKVLADELSHDLQVWNEECCNTKNETVNFGLRAPSLRKKKQPKKGTYSSTSTRLRFH